MNSRAGGLIELAAVLAALLACADTYNGAQPTYAQPAYASHPSAQSQDDGCTSDYGCPYGSRCVKHQFETEGYCAQETNQYGVPTYAPPRMNSVGPGNPDQCQFDTDCGPGWRCDKGMGLYGTCVR